MATTFAEATEGVQGVVGLVPTMGFLHEGHLSLIEAARSGCDTVVVTLFVNPLQFGEDADLEAYPRDLERDTALAAAAGTDVLFAPALATMFDRPTLTTVSVAEIGDSMEGLYRPGHFVGVATVVAKLFGGLRPARAFFGRKDAQQLVLIRRMTADLSFPIDIVGCPTVRERDGLALSSRNTRLEPAQRERALALSRGLMAAADAVESGERDSRALETLVAEHIDPNGGVALDYATVASQVSARPLAHLDEPAFLAGAIRVDEVRLIDNVHFDDGSDGVVVERGKLLAGPSVLYEED